MKKETRTSDKPGNRRDFIATTSKVAAAGAVMSAAGLNASIAHGGVHIASRETIRMGLIGAGGRGRGAVIQAMESDKANVELVAIGDAFDSRIDETLRTVESQVKNNNVRVTGDTRFAGADAYKRVLDSDIDLVMLATPPGFRPLHLEAAIDAGKHVFMEKPVAVDGPGVRRVLKASERAAEKKLSIACGLQRRHERAYQTVIEKLQNGAIGDLLVARVYWNQGGLWVLNKNPGESELSYQMRNWLYYTWVSGDHIVEQHIHNLDVINWLMNDYPVSARGMGGREVRLGPQHGQIFDHHAVEYDYSSGLKMFSFCRQIPGCWNSVSEWVHGSKGYCNISEKKIFDLQGNLISDDGIGENGHSLEQLDLIENLSNGVIQAEGEYGAKSTLTAIMGRLATYTGKPIPFEKALNSSIALADFDSITDLNGPAPVMPMEDGEYPVAVPGKNFKDYMEW